MQDSHLSANVQPNSKRSIPWNQSDSVWASLLVLQYSLSQRVDEKVSKYLLPSLPLELFSKDPGLACGIAGTPSGSGL